MAARALLPWPGPFLQHSAHVAVVAKVTHRSATVQENSSIIDIIFSCKADPLAAFLCPQSFCKVLIIGRGIKSPDRVYLHGN